MTTGDDLWDNLGSLEDEEALHVLTRLYYSYENIEKSDPKSKTAEQFFQLLQNAISYCRECNLNRR